MAAKSTPSEILFLGPYNQRCHAEIVTQLPSTVGAFYGIYQPPKARKVYEIYQREQSPFFDIWNYVAIALPKQKIK